MFGLIPDSQRDNDDKIEKGSIIKHKFSEDDMAEEKLLSSNILIGYEDGVLYHVKEKK